MQNHLRLNQIESKQSLCLTDSISNTGASIHSLPPASWIHNKMRLIPGSKWPKYQFLGWKIWTFAWYNGKSTNKFCWLFENIRILSHRKIWGFYGPSVPWLSSLSMPGSANPWCMAALLHPSAYPHTSRRCFHLQRLGGFMDVGKQAWRDIIYHLTWYHMVVE